MIMINNGAESWGAAVAARAAAGRRFLVGFRPCFGPLPLLELAHLGLRRHREACVGRVEEDGGEEGDWGRRGEFPVGGLSLRRLPLRAPGLSARPVVASKVQ